jgi:hypothetical protein
MTGLRARAAQLTEMLAGYPKDKWTPPMWTVCERIEHALREAVEAAAQEAEPQAGDDASTALRIAQRIRRTLLGQ